MFPINFNFPYRKKDGSLITMEKALDGAGADLDLIDLDDVEIESPITGEVLQYNGTSEKWENNTIELDVDDLGDVNITTPSDGDIMVYDDDTDKWVNSDVLDTLATKTELNNGIGNKAFQYHTSDSGILTVTGTNAYQQYIMTVFKGSVRAIYLITKFASQSTPIYKELVYITSGQTEPTMDVISTGDRTFTIDVPSSTQINIISTEAFTVAK